MYSFKRGIVCRTMLAIGLFQIAAYWFSGSMACDEGTIAVPQPDTPLYYQAARRIVEGHPFSYSEGTAPSTGTTTILYPFILSIPYALGAQGDAMLWAGFLVNAIFYLIFLWGWSIAARKWSQSEGAAVLTAVLIALSGHCAYVTFAQSDIGFLLAYTALLAAALATERRWAIGSLLVIGPWVRPEGMICVLAYVIVMLGVLICCKAFPAFKEKVSVGDIAVCVVSIISSLGVFGLNWSLTGHCQFSSVAGKGYFVNLAFPVAVFATISDLFTMVKEMFLGLAKTVPRDFISIPGLGGALLLVGVASYSWRRCNFKYLVVFLLAAFGGILSVAQSGWQGTNLDRYVAWTIPVAILFVANAVVHIEDRFVSSTFRKVPSLFVVLTSFVGAVGLVFVFNASSRDSDTSRHFSHECDKLMTIGSSYGSDGACAITYYCSPRRCAHLTGIYSPEFSFKCISDNIERLRHRPETRFDYWIFSPGIVALFGRTCVEMMGEVLLSGPDGMSLAKADWSMFNIPSCGEFDGKAMVASVDVGYDEDEQKCSYHVITRWGLEVFDPFVKCGLLKDKYIVDVGRVILGGDEMCVPLRPGADVIVVMRTWPQHLVNRNTGYPSAPFDCAFANPLKMNVSVDGNIVGLAEIAYATNAFTDVSFKIPGEAIKSDESRIGFLGDHITFGYRFYQ